MLWIRNGILGIAALAAMAAGGQAGEIYHSANYGSLDAANARIAELEAQLAQREVAYSTGCGCSTGCLSNCCGYVRPANWFDACCCEPTLVGFVAADSWRDAADVVAPNNFGGRFGLEATWNIADSGVRGHLGLAYAAYDLHGRGFPNPSTTEEQVFLTAGAYHRASGCCGDVWTWAAAYDYMHDTQYGTTGRSIDLHQLRGLVGYMVDPCNEFGVWGAVGIQDDELLPGEVGGFEGSRVDAQDSLNVYWRHYYDFGGETMFYVGLAQPNLSAPAVDINTNTSLREVVVGFRGIAPLSCNVGLFGGAHYVIPSASAPAIIEENWNISVGVIWVRGCNLPVLPVGDNGWFSKRLRGFFEVG